MKKQNERVIRKFLAIVLSAMLLLTAVPDMGISAKEQNNVKAEVKTSVRQPKELTTRVEVFSEDGHLQHVEVGIEDLKNVPNSMSSVGEAKSRNKNAESKTEGGNSNLPVAEIDDNISPVSNQFNFEYRDLINNGSDSENYCILIAGDGYTSGEQAKFLNTAQRVADYFMTRSPFNDEAIRNKINIRAVCTVSNQSGVSMDANNLYDTFFKSSFNNAGIERLLCIHDNDALDKIVQQYMPDCNVPIVVCNSTVYGGSGGSVCVVSDHEQATDIAFHEFGHTGGGLADEYWETTTDSTNGREYPNRTAESDPAKCKWSKFIGINGVGLYAFDENPAWYRPHQNCEMRYLNQEFCEVCKEQIRNVIGNVTQNKVGENEVIYNADQLKEYARKVALGAKTTNKTVTLANDITLSGSNNIDVMSEFNGTFNGNGHTIKGISINSSSGSTGFIGTLGANATVSNLTLESVSITASGYYIGGIAGNNKGTIYQCSVSGSVNGTDGVGGIAGHCEGAAVIRDCYNTASVYASSQVAGGIVGWMDDGNVSNSYNYGTISGGSDWHGAICGYKQAGTVANCYYLSGTGDGHYGGDAKSADEFSNGTITALLNSVNSVWKQGSGYPVFTYTGTPEQPEPLNAYEKIEAEKFTSNQGGVIDTNSNASGGYNIGGVTNGVNMQYADVEFSENAGAVTICYSSPTGVAMGNAEIYVDSMDNKVGTITLPNNGNYWAEYGVTTGKLVQEISAGKHTIFVKYVTTGSYYYVANVDYFKFVKASEVVTEPETTTPEVNTIDGGIMINGNQISAGVKGHRIVYSVDSTIEGKEVVSSGIVYSLAGYAAEEDLYVGSPSTYVRSFESTAAGRCNYQCPDSDIATSYAMTMKFATKEAAEFMTGWRVRAYAKLSDGSYVYTNSYTYTIFNVADILYQNGKMNTESAHNYLYDDILSIVDWNYSKKEFQWSNSILKA